MKLQVKLHYLIEYYCCLQPYLNLIYFILGFRYLNSTLPQVTLTSLTLTYLILILILLREAYRYKASCLWLYHRTGEPSDLSQLSAAPRVTGSLLAFTTHSRWKPWKSRGQYCQHQPYFMERFEGNGCGNYGDVRVVWPGKLAMGVAKTFQRLNRFSLTYLSPSQTNTTCHRL